MFDFTTPLIRAIKNGSEKAKTCLSEKKSISAILCDSVIVAGIATFAVMTDHIPQTADLWIMAKAFGATFLLELAIERGLKK